MIFLHPRFCFFLHICKLRKAVVDVSRLPLVEDCPNLPLIFVFKLPEKTMWQGLPFKHFNKMGILLLFVFSFLSLLYCYNVHS